MAHSAADLLRHLPFVRVAEPIRFPVGTGAGNRSAPRRDLSVDVELRERGSGAEPLPLRLIEVSATGCYVRTELLLPVGALVEMVFRMGDGEVVEAEGRVIRVEHRGGMPGMGIHFERVPPYARACLRQYTHWT